MTARRRVNNKGFAVGLTYTSWWWWWRWWWYSIGFGKLENKENHPPGRRTDVAIIRVGSTAASTSSQVFALIMDHRHTTCIYCTSCVVLRKFDGQRSSSHALYAHTYILYTRVSIHINIKYSRSVHCCSRMLIRLDNKRKG